MALGVISPASPALHFIYQKQGTAATDGTYCTRLLYDVMAKAELRQSDTVNHAGAVTAVLSNNTHHNSNVALGLARSREWGVLVIGQQSARLGVYLVHICAFLEYCSIADYSNVTCIES